MNAVDIAKSIRQTITHAYNQFRSTGGQYATTVGRYGIVVGVPGHKLYIVFLNGQVIHETSARDELERYLLN